MVFVWCEFLAKPPPFAVALRGVGRALIGKGSGLSVASRVLSVQG